MLDRLTDAVHGRNSQNKSLAHCNSESASERTWLRLPAELPGRVTADMQTQCLSYKKNESYVTVSGQCAAKKGPNGSAQV